jgi:small subunit ribosomal protein S1
LEEKRTFQDLSEEEKQYMTVNEKGEIVPNYEMTIVSFNEGDIIKGTVVKVNKDEVLVDVGYKSEGVIPPRELSVKYDLEPHELVSVNDEIEVLVLQKEDQDGRLILSKKRAETQKAFEKIIKAYEEEKFIKGEVIELVRGGLIVDIGMRAFLPGSLIDLKKVTDFNSYLGKEVKCKVINIDKNKNSVILSRKAYLEEEKRVLREKLVKTIKVGQVKKGSISNIADFGAFVDLGGVDGLIHISELSWGHVSHPSEVVQIGDEVEVVVLDVDKEKKRVYLGLKQTQIDPWMELTKKYAIGDVVEGKVIKIVPFGAFVQIEEGIEGLVHISEIAVYSVEKPEEVVSIGDKVKVKIIDIDFDRRRIGLSIRQVPRAKKGVEEVKEKPKKEAKKKPKEEVKEKIEEAKPSEEKLKAKKETKEEKTKAKKEAKEVKKKTESKKTKLETKEKIKKEKEKKEKK